MGSDDWIGEGNMRPTWSPREMGTPFQFFLWLIGWKVNTMSRRWLRQQQYRSGRNEYQGPVANALLPADGVRHASGTWVCVAQRAEVTDGRTDGRTDGAGTVPVAAETVSHREGSRRDSN